MPLVSLTHLANSAVQMVFRIETSRGTLSVPIIAPDRGDLASNEANGAACLRAFFEEAAELLGASFHDVEGSIGALLP